MANVPLIVKTAAGVDVSKQYEAKTGNYKKPFYLSQRFIGMVVGLLCSTLLSKYALPADKIESFINLVISNWDGIAAIAGIGWALALEVKGSFNKKGRKEAEKQVLKDRLKECESDSPQVAELLKTEQDRVDKTINAVKNNEAPPTVEDPTGVSPHGE